MSERKEISRRSFYHEDEGIACGPVSSTAIVSEIVIEKDGQKIYLHGEWVDIAGEYGYQATSESLFDVYEKLNNAASEEEEAAAVKELDRINANCYVKDEPEFKPFYAELKQMIHDEMKAHDLEYIYEDEEEDEDEEDE